MATRNLSSTAQSFVFSLLVCALAAGCSGSSNPSDAAGDAGGGADVIGHDGAADVPNDMGGGNDAIDVAVDTAPADVAVDTVPDLGTPDTGIDTGTLVDTGTDTATTPDTGTSCVGGTCPSGLTCCASTGMCYSPACLACCMPHIVDAGPPDVGTPDVGLPDVTPPVDAAGGCTDNTMCLTSQFCDGTGCGTVGACATRPTICPFIVMPTCGCDGTTYTNVCVAHRAGVRVAHSGACP